MSLQEMLTLSMRSFLHLVASPRDQLYPTDPVILDPQVQTPIVAPVIRLVHVSYMISWLTEKS